ncbi:KH domain-containing protein [Nitratifractor sp.]|uniref:KH domain-containing protein n=1 Tax=Nitratifractor sp. TaxID=2268144 RepID=UPI0025CDEAB7|nr:KH domain-containing protein [Nitratifractor sp.]
MVRDFILSYARLIVRHPGDLRIEKRELDEDYEEITLYAHAEDVGKLIGKEGRMINAIKAVVSGCKAKDGKSYRLNVQAAG